MLDVLPSEVLFEIADFLPQDSLRAVARASRRLHAILTPVIYQSITLRAASEWALSVLDVDSFFLHHDYSRAQHYLRHTRHLCIQAPIQLVRFSRCAYYSIFRMTGMNGCLPDAVSEAVAHEQFLHDLGVQASRILSRLKPNNLRTFKWRLGTCIPKNIFGADGYLAHCQAHIENLELQTDGTCLHAQHGLAGLAQLRSVKTLKWCGIQHREEVESLRQSLRRNHAHLGSLSLGFTPSAFANLLSWNHLVCQGLDNEVAHTQTSMNFTSLEELSLAQITLPTYLRPDENFTFCGLRSLSLSHCPNQLRFLSLMSKAPGRIRLDSFEGCFDLLQDNHRHANAINEFLLSFRGLRDLHLHLSNFPALGSAFMDAIYAHRDTLRSFVYHERQLAPLGDSGLFEEQCDVSPGWTGELDKIIDQRQIVFLALSICPVAAHQRKLFESAREHSQVQLLHLRLSGPERLHRNLAQEIRTALLEMQQASSACSVPPVPCIQDNNPYIPGPSFSSQVASLQNNALSPMSEAKALISFASWAFGPQGISSLKVLAFGDFSHEDRYEAQRFLIRRWDSLKESRVTSKFPGFVPIQLGDLDTGGGPLVNGARFLAACPEGGLMESPYDF